ncbi:hypothetical protein A2526_05900 [candidate division WOR-1 bacterium RIFOXYD2_FULL_36_8]|uniref:HD domain-containing protein n=1 Tax=candidate division WOR-1 bacterium RIFOXYB2_FULL_36_35 TaxID=1802578 RepID=A0A1F4RYQ1_UNCSA|nr:MAG: hypothetical protein A2230_08760 [candidate division WOR-1 bacterium RIFOXYA2_FULL_36_21]OGC13300.1 MAG: hypothetical protein A2290_08205 [candidate division WOR-1 bacterium RIFOXYB2_FULL_36_35]OGC16779.1 MAG: hypothetical protein A2282_04785 [candidate division WOR-1 bacterium RIFOXYA12_FULL_36_13]OGC37466.1 MAG: hypothetical protein A2526_05900 [candidate division WOR-1 bacterium RIFOXYD2_FULL_36_8]
MFKKSKIPSSVKHIIKTLKSNGYKAYLVGGAVRDLLLKNKPNEWDITTDALPKDVSMLFDKVVPTGIKYGTVTVIIKRETFEVTTFRKDEKYVDGRHPSNVKFTQELKEDLSRRDFTINAMAYDPLDNELVDIFGGQKDLKHKIIKAVGDPVERFSEDGLRPVRACRFAASLDFKIENKTFAAISKTLKIVKKVAAERVCDEIKKLLKAKKPSIGIENMRNSGILELFIPELAKSVGVKQPEPYHKYDVYWHSLYSCDAVPKENLIVRLAALLHDIAKPECKDGEKFYNHDQVGSDVAIHILRRLKFSNEIIDSVANLVENHMFNYESSWKDSAVRRFIRRVGRENLPDLFVLRLADCSAMGRKIDNGYLKKLQKRIDKIIKDENALHVTDLKINGEDVMRKLKIKPGPNVGKVLNDILERVIEDPSLNDKKILLDMVCSHES